MRDIPLLMTGPLVRKAMAGEKSQTRRLKFRGEVGDRIHVRETLLLRDDGWVYAADSAPVFVDDRDRAAMLVWAHHKPGERCQSIHMPKFACRLWLEVTGLRVEPLNDITEADAIAEGMQRSAAKLWCGKPHDAHGMPRQHNTAREAFADVWDAINYAKAPWVSNPAVRVVTFKRIETPAEVNHG
jgi:hypothetical protein